MALECEVVLRWDSTPAQRRALGNALWTWCMRAGGKQIYQYLVNRALADLAVGQLPSCSQLTGDGHKPYAFFTVPGHSTHDRVAALEHLRQTLPSQEIADVRIGGAGWCVAN
jgi:hypothetical protein